jgi:D-alanyl-D-alanine carboxypeptidase (penicillin-binding protein 5/6)
MKTGYTRSAGNTLIGAATRNGRTMISVVLNAVDAPGFSAQLLDQGFFVPVRLQGARGRLPPVAATLPRVSDAAPVPRQRVQVVAAPAPVERAGESALGRDLLLVAIGTLPALGILIRRRRREGRPKLFSWG